MIIHHKGKSIDNLVTKIGWSGSRLQVARALEFTYIFEPRDSNIEPLVLELGETIQAYSEDNTLVFQGNIYRLDRDTNGSSITVKCYDNMYILTKSKTTRKFTNMTADEITNAICREMGIKVGELISTGERFNLICPEKTGYQIIQAAYTKASKKTGKKYYLIMVGDSLHVVEKGTLLEGVIISQNYNTMNSSYFESIENMVNSVMITDEEGNFVGTKQNEEWVKKYSMIQAVYKSSEKKNTSEEVEAMMKGPERGGTIDAIGDYKVVSSYSVQIDDIVTQLSGQFWVKSDSHTFVDGTHTMRLEIEFENLMNEEKDDEEKELNKEKNKSKRKESKQNGG